MAVTVMQRYEMKYLMDAARTEYFLRQIEGRMQIDEYGLTSIASLYYDTPDARLVRASLEKPAFKEKLRLRSYGLATDTSPVYLEAKRKVDGVVYKRRAATTVPEAERFFMGGTVLDGGSQIGRELARFRDHYERLAPACLIVYDRAAYFDPCGDLRLTVDHRPRYRVEDLTLTKSMDGTPLLEDGWTILEIKVQGAMPLWLSAVLSGGEIFKSSFSKYGEAFRRELIKAGENPTGPAAPDYLGAA